MSPPSFTSPLSSSGGGGTTSSLGMPKSTKGERPKKPEIPEPDSKTTTVFNNTTTSEENSFLGGQPKTKGNRPLAKSKMDSNLDIEVEDLKSPDVPENSSSDDEVNSVINISNPSNPPSPTSTPIQPQGTAISSPLIQSNTVPPPPQTSIPLLQPQTQKSPPSAPTFQRKQNEKEIGQGTIKINGEDYYYAIFCDAGDEKKWKLTRQEWEQVALKVNDFFQNSTSNKPLEEANIELALTKKNLNSTNLISSFKALEDQQVTITRAQVTYKETANTKQVQTKSISNSGSPVLFKNLPDSACADTLLNANPITTTKTIASGNKKTENNELVEVCKNRQYSLVKDKEEATYTSPHFPLGEQFLQLPSWRKISYNGTVEQGAHRVRQDALFHITKLVDDPIDKHRPGYKTFPRMEYMNNLSKKDERLYLLALEQCGYDLDFKEQIKNETFFNLVNLWNRYKFRRVYTKYIELKQDQWFKENLPDILDSLKKAREKEFPILQDCLKEDLNQVLDLLTTSRELEKDEKLFLARSYDKYIEHIDSRFVGPTYFRAFVEEHQRKDKKNFFQIVVITEHEDGTETAQSYPPGEDIEPLRCAFIHFDEKTRTYASYQRASSSSLQDLNTDNRIIPCPCPRPTITEPDATSYDSESEDESESGSSPPPPPPSLVQRHVDPIPNPVQAVVDLRPTPGNGQCLDSSISYGLLVREGHKNPTDDAEILKRANELRQTVSKYISSTDTLNLDHNFLMALNATLRNMSKLPYNVNDSINQDALIDFSKQVDQKMLDRRIEARKYYAQYILKGENYLDMTFLMVLNEAIKNTNTAPFNVAVVQGKDIIHAFPGNRPIDNSPNTVFVNYNGVDHYSAVDMNGSRSQTLIPAMITNYNNKS